MASAIFPPGIQSADEFEKIIDELKHIVGSANVISPVNGRLPTEYYDPFGAAFENVHWPSLAVLPGSVREVQEVVRCANKFFFPLWAVSRGKNLGYGGPSPVIQGSVIVDLGVRMKSIIEVDEKLCYAIVEPGVTFFDLYEYLKAHNMKVWMSVPAIGWGSIIGNCLERGFGYTPTGIHESHQCGMEVVLPDGDVVRSGMGAMTGNKTWASYKGGFGPAIDGLFFQSAMGIVTKIGIWLYPAPQSVRSCIVNVFNEKDIVPLTDILCGFLRDGTIQNSPSVQNVARQIMLDTNKPLERSAFYFETGAMTDAYLEETRIKNKWGKWKVNFAIYGDNKIGEIRWQIIKTAILKAIPTASCVLVSEYVGKDSEPLRSWDVPDEEIPHQGKPTLMPIHLTKFKGPEGGHIDVSAVLPTSGKDMYEWYKMTKVHADKAGIDIFVDYHLFPHYIIAIDLFLFEPKEAKTTDLLCKDLIEETRKLGFSIYRTHVNHMALVKKHFDFNNHALGRYLDKLKDATDPNGIINPGKQGVYGTFRSKKQSLL